MVDVPDLFSRVLDAVKESIENKKEAADLRALADEAVALYTDLQ
jgi:hypothetical protein